MFGKMHNGMVKMGAMLAVVASTEAMVSNTMAAVSLKVDVLSGDIQIIGQPGDTLSCYVIFSASGSTTLNYTNWNYDRFGGTPVGASTSTSVAAGNGTWHAMGTVSPITGSTVTAQLGEMCAVWAGFNTNGATNANTSKIYTFDDTHTVIDLGSHFVAGSVEDLVFGYGTTPGFMNGSAPSAGWIFDDTTTSNPYDGTIHDYYITSGRTAAGTPIAGSYYAGNHYVSSGVLGTIDYVPEPASLSLLTLAAGGLLLRRRK